MFTPLGAIIVIVLLMAILWYFVIINYQRLIKEKEQYEIDRILDQIPVDTGLIQLTHINLDCTCGHNTKHHNYKLDSSLKRKGIKDKIAYMEGSLTITNCRICSCPEFVQINTTWTIITK